MTGFVRGALAAAFLTIVSGAASVVQAQVNCNAGTAVNGGCNRPLSFSFTVTKVTRMTVSPAPGFSLLPASGSVSNAQYNAGFYDVASTMSVTFQSNSTWNATITGTSGTFGAPCATKPASDLLWGRTTTTRTTPISSTATPLLTTTTNTATAGTTTTLFFRVNNVTWTSAPPGTCTVPFTISIL